MIELAHISKNFGSGQQQVHAVQDVSLTIRTGEIFGIIGFSGAGKSTLVRCINLLERPTAGTVMVDNKDLTALSARELPGEQPRQEPVPHRAANAPAVPVS